MFPDTSDIHHEERYTMTDQIYPASGTWELDASHTSVHFNVRHLMAAKVRGTFTALSGTVDMGDTPETSSVQVSIDAGSIDTGDADRDAHLRSPEFLDVEQYPTLEFVSTAVRPAGNAWAIDGELTLVGVTRPVTLDMEFHGLVNDPWGNSKAVFSASTKFDREDWGLTWNAALETGGWLVGKTISIDIDVQAAKVPATV
jgi:polyisoprenoid-binding protein YceI